MKTAYLFLFSLLFSICQAQTRGFVPVRPDGSQERRLALVIGNNDYEKPSLTLTNAANDADDMRAALEKIGFDVLMYKNLDYRSLNVNIDKFVNQLSNYDVGLVHYSGHGVSYLNQNYLVPTDADIRTVTQIEYDCYSLNKLIAKMEGSGVKNTIVMLDACRNTPILPPSSRSTLQAGLVAPLNPHGTYIVFATQEGSVASDAIDTRNGLFTGALLKNITLPDLTLKQIIDRTKKEVREKSDGAQLPNAYDQIEGDFYFIRSSNKNDATPPSASALRDSDGDGIVDEMDQCPYEYGPITNFGCPEGSASGKDTKDAPAEIQRGISLYIAGKYSEALPILLKGAPSDISGSSSNYLGDMYFYGQGVAADFVESAKWYRKAADQGNSNGQNNLGYLYNNGLGVQKDYVEAAKWYRKAADQGQINALFNIGYMYRNGLGVAQDDSEAIKWYHKAAEKQNSAAQNSLGFAYQFGYGVQKDYVEAIQWYRKAADQGSPEAQNNLGIMYENGYGTAVNYTEAEKWYRKAANQGYSGGQNNLGVLYHTGNGIAKDYGQAAAWYRKAAAQNHPQAQYNLGLLCQYGLGVSQDNAEAVKWYIKSCDAGYAPACDKAKSLR